MKQLILVLIIAGVFLNTCEASTASDLLKEFGRNITTSANKLKDRLAVVGGALKDVAVDRFKGIAGQGVQALVGAILESFKNFDPFGKRELQTDVQEFLNSLGEEVKVVIEAMVHKTFAKISDIIKKLATSKPVEEIHAELDDIIDEHKMAVRGFFGDALNTAIDGIRKLWYKGKELVKSAKDKLLGGSDETADPVMIGRRALLDDAWNKFMQKVKDIKEELAPKVEQVTEVASNISAALKHHAGKVFDQMKENAVDKVEETLGYLHDELHRHLDNAKDAFNDVKEDAIDSLLSFLA